MQTLRHDVRQGDVVGVGVIGIERQHTARQQVHQIGGRRTHDDIAHKAVGQGAIGGQQIGEDFQLSGIRQVPDQQEVDRLLKAETVLGDKAADKVLDVDAAVAQLAVAVFLAAHLLLCAVHRGDLGQACEHAFSGGIAQAALDVIFCIERCFDMVCLRAFLGEVVDI